MAAAAIGGRVRHFDLGRHLLDACPTLRRHYDSDSGLSALCAFMREEQAGEIYAALGPWAETEDLTLGRRPELGSDVPLRFACTEVAYSQ